MEPIIFTPRLKMTLVTRADQGSQELEWFHELYSNEEAMAWNLYGRTNSMEESEKAAQRQLPEENAYKVTYAVHEILESTGGGLLEGNTELAGQSEKPTRFVGVASVKSVDPANDASRRLVLPEHLTVPATETTLVVEVAYMFLPTAWNKGYATESVKATFEACKRARAFWAPFSKVYVRSIVNDVNPASMRVMDKTGITKKGVYEWSGEAFFLGGEWRDRCDLHIYGMYLLE